jgi:hypothetical protein
MMKRILLWTAVMAVAVILSGCFAFLPQSDGYLSIDVQIPPELKGPDDHPVVIFVANADMESTIKELLWLIDKSTAKALSSKEEDRLIDLAMSLSNRGLVKFGGDPFLRTKIPALTADVDQGSIKIPAVPAGRSYFVKVFVFAQGQDIVNIDEVSDITVVAENQLFNPEVYSSDWTAWTREASTPFPIKVEVGQATEVDITLGPEL